MSRVVKLTERDLNNLVKKVLQEQQVETDRKLHVF